MEYKSPLLRNFIVIFIFILNPTRELQTTTLSFTSQRNLPCICLWKTFKASQFGPWPWLELSFTLLESFSIACTSTLLPSFQAPSWRLHLTSTVCSNDQHLCSGADSRLCLELFYDALLPGRYTWRLKDLHAKYGKIAMIHVFPNVSRQDS